MTKFHFFALATCLGMVATSAVPVDAQGPIRNRIQQRLQTRIGDQAITPYFERDRLLDITEWFDGNNYNPTNEVVDRLTDLSQRETRAQAAFDYGVQNEWFGFQSETNADNRWFYDFYDHGLYSPKSAAAQTSGSTSYRYYDTDHNGLYDAYTVFTDRDADGKPDSQQWFAYDNDFQTDGTIVSTEKHVDHDQKTLTTSPKKMETVSLRNSVSGTVIRTKQTRTPTAMHTVVELKTDAPNETFFVDIGPATESENWSIEKGDKISATGPVVDIGDRQLMLADEVSMDSEKHTVNREFKSWKGVIVDTHPAEIRGQKTMMAIVYTPEKDRVLVDLGPVDQVEIDTSENAMIMVKGVPMEVDNRTVVMAHEIEQNGQMKTITRVTVSTK